MKRWLSILAFVFSFGVVDAMACSCDLPPLHQSQKQLVTRARKTSQAVFSGVVLKINEAGYGVRVSFKVDAFWKGGLPAEIVVTTGRGYGDCGYQFEKGQRYLVYAYGSDSASLVTNICQRTAPYAEAAADVMVLGKPKPPVT